MQFHIETNYYLHLKTTWLIIIYLYSYLKKKVFSYYSLSVSQILQIIISILKIILQEEAN